jgi:nucleotide-binding universal stress UspA family protein
MKNIIVPLDFSADSVKGLELALLFSRKAPVTIQLVYVQKKTDVPSLAEEEYRLAERNFKKIIDAHANKLGESSTITHIIKKGKVFNEIVGQAQAFQDSIIITSTHGSSGFEELFMGSNTYKIVCATNKPVITIRQEPIPKDIKKIILPIDIVVESRQKVMFTALIAQLFDAEIHVVTVSTSKSKKINNRLNAYSQQVCNYLNSVEIQYKVAATFGRHLINQVLEYAENEKADLISIINESGDSLTDLIINGEAQQMISKSPIPVLVIRAKSHFIKDSFSTFGG